MCVLPSSHDAAPLPPAPVLEGVWDHFRAWKCIGAQGCVLLALGRAQSAPQSAPTRAKVSKGTPKARFLTSLGNPFGANRQGCCL